VRLLTLASVLELVIARGVIDYNAEIVATTSPIGVGP